MPSASAFERLCVEIRDMLSGVNRYNPQNLEQLQDYVEAQVEEQRYDLEANLTVLKLYQLNPDLYNADIAVKILLKAIVQLPEPDITTAKCLIDQAKITDEPISTVMKLAADIETCQFETVWEALQLQPEFAKTCPELKPSLIKFICHVVGITYQNIEKQKLMTLLGNEVSEAAFAELCNKNNWKVKEDGSIQVSNIEDSVKSRNIGEKINLENIRDIMRAAA